MRPWLRCSTLPHASSAVAVILPMLIGAGCALRAPPNADDIRAQTMAHTAIPSHWIAAAGATSAVVADGWLQDFSDSQLDSYVKEALAYNLDLESAAARVEQARHYAIAAGAALYPAVNAIAHGGNSSTPDSGWTGGFLSFSWELDVWGRVRAGRAAASEQYLALQEDYAYARQSIAAMTAKSWLLATEARLQEQIAADAVATAEQLVAVAQQRRKVGAGSEYDIATAQASLENFLDTRRQLQFAYQQSLRALESLLGRYPSATIATASALPQMPVAVPVGLPSQLLERRPDVVAAERRVAAAFDLAQQAKAARLPTISLTGSVSSISSDLFVLQDRDNPLWSAGASLFAPLFQGGKLKAQQDIRTAQQKQAMADYARVGLRAFNEVEGALASEFASAEREQILQRAVADNEHALALARRRYSLGASDLRDMLAQQIALYAANTKLLRVKTDVLVQRINLHLALGGSFEPALPAEPDKASPPAHGAP